MTVVREKVIPITTVIPAQAGIQAELDLRCFHPDPTRLDLDNNIYELSKDCGIDQSFADALQLLVTAH